VARDLSFVRLPEFYRTTSFRLAIVFLLFFGAAATLLCGFVYWQTKGYLVERTERQLAFELATFEDVDGSQLQDLLAAHSTMDPRLERPAILFAPGGQRIVGTAVDPPAFRMQDKPLDRIFEFNFSSNGRPSQYRGLLHRLPSGQYLLVAQAMAAAHAFDRLLLRSCIIGGVVTVLLGLIGAAIAGADAVRRIDGVTAAIQRIVRGKLSERLPTRGDSHDLDRLAQEINFMLGEIEHLMQEMKGVCDNIAHDLRTPLTRLLAGLERARRRSESMDDYAAAVDGAIAEIRELLKTFAAMLRISEVESGARRAGFVELDLSQIATDVFDYYEPMAEEKGVTLQRSCDGAVKMQGDPSLLFEAVSNLVDNALKFTPPRGRVGLSSFADGERRGIVVTDTGPGIPTHQRNAVLKRFYRAEDSRHTPGSGLGLALVAGVAGLHEMAVDIADAVPGCRIALVTVHRRN
jgi:signal transduction histidine kinase